MLLVRRNTFRFLLVIWQNRKKKRICVVLLLWSFYNLAKTSIPECCTQCCSDTVLIYIPEVTSRYIRDKSHCWLSPGVTESNWLLELIRLSPCQECSDLPNQNLLANRYWHKMVSECKIFFADLYVTQQKDFAEGINLLYSKSLYVSGACRKP